MASKVPVIYIGFQHDDLYLTHGFYHVLAGVDTPHNETTSCPRCNAQLTLEVTPGSKLKILERLMMIGKVLGVTIAGIVIGFLLWYIPSSLGTFEYGNKLGGWIVWFDIIAAIFIAWFIWNYFIEQWKVFVQGNTHPKVVITASTSDMQIHSINEKIYVTHELVVSDVSESFKLGCFKGGKAKSEGLFSNVVGETEYHVSPVTINMGSVRIEKIEKRRCSYCGKDIFFRSYWNEKAKAYLTNILNSERRKVPYLSVGEVDEHVIIWR